MTDRRRRDVLVVLAVLAMIGGLVGAAALPGRGGIGVGRGGAADEAAARAHVERGRALLGRQRLVEAHDAFVEAIRRDPASADGHRGLAAVAYDQGALVQAVTHLERVAALDPADARPYRMIGHICRDLDRHERAVASYREALARGLGPAVADEVRVELAEQLLALGDAAGAVAALPSPSQRADESARVLAVRGEAAWILSGAEAALAIVEPAADREPDAPALASLLGRLRVDLARWSEAIEPLERAVAAGPDDLAALAGLATACERLGRAGEAGDWRRRRDETQAALERLSTLGREADAEPWNDSVREELAGLCDRLGKVELAAMWRHAAAQARSRVTADPDRRPSPRP
jgi:tetratricopeptide (TPR) repeat protein